MKNIQTFSYHCHTTFSDGQNSLEEMIRNAEYLGFTELGISDHLIVHKDFSKSLSLPYIHKRGFSHIYNSEFKTILPAFQRHCDEIRRLSAKTKVKLYAGFEVDFFTYDGWFEELKDFLSQLDYDYLISGNHMLFDENGEGVFDMNDLPELCTDKVKIMEYMQRHFRTIGESIKSGVFKFVAHIDYARKLGKEICSAESCQAEKVGVVSLLKKYGVGTEISTKGLRKIGDFYPCGWLLEKIAEANIPVVISDDAHRVSEMADNFETAEKALQKYKIKNRLHF